MTDGCCKTRRLAAGFKHLPLYTIFEQNFYKNYLKFIDIQRLVFYTNLINNLSYINLYTGENMNYINLKARAKII